MSFPAESVLLVGGFGIVITTAFMVRMSSATSALYLVWGKSAMPLKACWKFAASLGPVVAQRPRLHPSRDGCRAFRDRSSPRGAMPPRGDDRARHRPGRPGRRRRMQRQGGQRQPPPPARAHPGRRFSGVIFGGVMAERS